MNHNLLTHMLFVDAIVGVGFPDAQAAGYAAKEGLATIGRAGKKAAWDEYTWNRTALDELDLTTLQDLYTGLKLYEVTYAN
jgi:hypothetical protein